MGHPWIAVDTEIDLVAWARLLRRAHDLSLSKGTSASILRKVVADSWMRCMSAGVDPERPAPKMLDESQVSARFESHPLARALPLIRSLLADAAEEGHHIMALSDADGLLLYAEGQRAAMRRAEEPHFLPGFLCSESAVGTNAIGTSLAVDHPVQIFSAEHFNRLLHTWTCAAAPIHDPQSKRLLGALNVSGSFRSAHPHSLSLVCAVAQAVETHLAREMARRDDGLKSAYVERLSRASQQRSALVNSDGRVVMALPSNWLPEQIEIPAAGGVVSLPGGTTVIADPVENGQAHILWQVNNGRPAAPKPKLRLEALGSSRASACSMGERMEFGLRHSEILVLLALHPRGLSAEEVAMQLYNAADKRITVRAEISRLRKRLGSSLAANPYRLVADLQADFLDVQRLVDQGHADAAVARYTGALLPRSDVPAIVAARQRLEEAVLGPAAQHVSARSLPPTPLRRGSSPVPGIHVLDIRKLTRAAVKSGDVV